MGYSIVDNYSVFNNYNYNDKSCLLSTLDLLSTPIRRVLGGRNVCAISNTYEDEMSTAGKVATVIFSVLIFPIAIVSIASLLAKLAMCPCTWQKEVVVKNSQEGWKIIEQFNEAIKNGEDDKALEHYMKHTDLENRDEIYNTVFKIINRKINNGASWAEIQNLIPLLRTNSAIELINYAIKLRLNVELKENQHFAQADQIIAFIQACLKGHSSKDLESCYERILCDALIVDVNDNMIHNIIKLDLADHLIHALLQVKLSTAKDEITRQVIKLTETPLRLNLFQNSQNYLSLYSMFTSKDDMKKLQAAVQGMREVNQMGWNFLNKLREITAQKNVDLQQRWNQMRAEFSTFDTHMKSIFASVDESEKTYIASIQSVYNVMIKFTDSMWNVSSPEEIKGLILELETTTAKQIKDVQALNENTKFSSSKSDVDILVATLRAKRRIDLLSFTEWFKQILETNMNLIGVELIKKLTS